MGNGPEEWADRLYLHDERGRKSCEKAEYDHAQDVTKKRPKKTPKGEIAILGH
jgi:hypothetical protein